MTSYVEELIDFKNNYYNDTTIKSFVNEDNKFVVDHQVKSLDFIIQGDKLWDGYYKRMIIDDTTFQFIKLYNKVYKENNKYTQNYKFIFFNMFNIIFDQGTRKESFMWKLTSDCGVYF